MGVISCDRKDCENVMCDITVANKNVCNECADEFMTLMGNEPKTPSDMGREFINFMKSPKPEYRTSGVELTAQQFFDQNRRSLR